MYGWDENLIPALGVAFQGKGKNGKKTEKQRCKEPRSEVAEA